MNIDLRPIIDGVVFPVITAVVVPLVAGYAALTLRRIAAYFHLQVTAQAGAVVEAAIANGATLAIARAQQRADSLGVVTTKNAVVAEAVNYALPKIAAEMKTAGITPDSIAERVEARLPADIKAVIAPTPDPGAPQ